MNSLKFSSSQGIEFSKELREGVKAYFKDKKNRYGDSQLMFKSILMIFLYIIPFTLLGIGVSDNPWVIFTLYICSGFGMAGIGMNVMHDALHGSFSKNKRINKLMGYSINLIGASGAIWKIQHNVLHHTYTNVKDADEDIDGFKILRFSPEQKRRFIHRFQFLYAWVFYGLLSLIWVTIRDFKRVFKYRRMGFFDKKMEFSQEIIKSIGLKIVYFFFALVLPIISVPEMWLTIVLAFLCMHFLAGMIISLVFQTAHIMPTSSFPKSDENGNLENSRLIHQMLTTSNFAPNSRLLSWFIGGLNYQIEHHLMPNISHIHYRGLSKMVKELAEKHGLPYHSQKTFVHAILSHHKLLLQLGRA